MKKNIFRSVQFRIIALMILFMTVTFLASLYTINYASKTAVMKEKEGKLLDIASYLSDKLGDQTYDDILSDSGALTASKEEKISVLNLALKSITDDVASIYPGMAVGYYSRELDAILTYGPSEEYSDKVGLAIDPNHPGRTVMAENTPLVRKGTMVRGNIMNAMYPIERNGTVIGYAWANELTTDIEKEYMRMISQTIILLSAFFTVAVSLAVYLSRRTTRDIAKIVSGLKYMKNDLSKRILGVSGELGEVAESINNMAEFIEQSNKEHEALILAEAANKAQREFLARMSHEIRTPMNGVLGMTRMAMQADTKEKSLEYLKKIQSSAAILLGVINDILDFSKIEANKLELETHPFDIPEMVENIRDLIIGRIEEKGLAFKINVDSLVPRMALGDGLKLSQVLLNLLGNAVKFTEKGSVGLEIKSEPPVNGQLKLHFAVSDTGIGMDEEQIKLLFKPFSQADNSMARRFGGTGLGLSISKALITLMNGEVSVTSTLNVGSTFSFYILLESFEGAYEPKAEETDILKNRYDGKKALLAEDNEINQEIAVALLSEFGLEIDVVPNGKIAVDAYKNKDYDLIFMDIQMPVMDGFEATRLIRESESQLQDKKRTPIIAMTANAMQEDRKASSEVGMDAHIAKPLEFDEIREALHKVFDTPFTGN